MKKLITFLLLLVSVVSIGQGTLVFGTSSVEAARVKLKGNPNNYTLTKVDTTFKIVGLTNTYDIKFGDGESIATRSLTLTPGTGVSITGGTQTLEANRSWTISIPQSVSTSASPTFAGITLSGLSNGILKSTSGVVSSSSIVNADISTSAAIDYTKITGLTVDNVAALKLKTGTYNGQLASVLGYYTYADGGEGNFYWNATSTATDNGGTIIQVTGVSTGRWIRIIGNNDVNVKWFGVKDDNSTDNIQSIRKAISFVSSLLNKTILFESSTSTYNISDSLYIDSGINVKMYGQLKYTGSANKTIVTIGNNASNNSKTTLILNVTRNITDWNSESAIGISLYNCISCDIKIIESSNSTVGAKLIGENSRGFSYNKIEIVEISGCKVGLDLVSNTNGFVNENVFNGGRLTCYTGQNVGKERIGVRIRCADGTYVNNNNNIFYKPCFELKADQSSPNLAIPIQIYDGNLNQFLDIRNEFNSTYVAYIYNASTENKITQAYGTGDIVDNSSAPNNLNEESRNLQLNTSLNLIYYSGKLVDRVKYYDGSSSFIQISGVNLPSSSGSSTNIANSFTAITNNYIEFTPSRGVGVFVDTDVVKEFVVKPSYETGAGARVMIRCYDSAGNIITTGDMVKGSSTNPFSYNSSFGGVFRTGANSESQVFFSLADTVKKVCVIFASVSTNMKIKSFSIFTPNKLYNTQVYSGYSENISSGNGVTASPTVGTWTRGTVLFNVTPSVGSNVGWICTTAGTPGTWTKFGAIELTGSTTYDPTSLSTLTQTTTTVTATGAALGDYVQCSFSNSLAGITLTGYVSATNTVTCVFYNGTSGTVDLASGTLKVKVTKQ